MEQQKIKEWLLKGVTKATKEVQFLYAQEKKPIKECRASRHLCATFENILRNGLRSRLLGFRHKNSFWPLVLKISRRQAINYITSLQHAHSEMGRCRAWIRLAVNECALENYIGVLCQDESLLNQYYETSAFLRDQEMREALKHLFIGLSELCFEIDVDTVSLEFEAPPEALQVSHLRMRPVKAQQKQKGRQYKGSCISTNRDKSHKRTKASASSTTKGQEELDTSSDGSTVSTDEDYDDASYNDDDETTTTTTGTDPSLKDNEVVVDSQKEHTSQFALVDNLPSEEPMMLNQLAKQSDCLNHHLGEPFPPAYNSSDQLVDNFKNPELETDQSFLFAVDNATSITDTKITPPISDLENEESLLAVVDSNVTSVVENKIAFVVSDTEKDDFIDGANNLISSVDQVIEEIMATEVLVEHKGNELPANETHRDEKTENKSIKNEDCMYIEHSEMSNDVENSTKSELSCIVEEHYSKEATRKELIKQIGDIRKELLKLQPNMSKYQVLEEEMSRLNILLEQAQQDSKCEIVFGHKLIRQRGPSLQSWSCDACGHKSLNLLKPHYQCQECGFSCHMKCISLIGSTCISAKLGNEVKLILEICPETTLTAQQFRCYSCNKSISYGNAQMEPQLCDYTGAYHCPDCHHNQTHMIPARVVHNWDFTEHKVCCSCFDLLQVLSVRPLLHLHKISPTLYTYVQDLDEMEQLRNDFIIMKNFFVDCLVAKEQKLLQKLDQWPHFKENSKLFSLHDLHNIATGDLMVQLKETHQIYSNHITLACRICRSRGITCTLCRAPELLYPFNEHVSVCPHCSLLFHKSCYETSQCPQCAEKP